MTTFHSTRSTTDSLTSKQAIRKGIADDGGLFVTGIPWARRRWTSLP